MWIRCGLVLGVELRVKSLGLAIEVVGFESRGEDSRFRDKGLGCRGLSSGFRV